MRCLLLNMPLASISRPALGISLLKPALEIRGVECEVLYPCVDFALALGTRAYERIAVDLPHAALLGEWIFAESIFGSDQVARDAYVDEVLRARCHLTPEDVDLALTARAQATAFIDEMTADVDWRSFDIVGFASTTAQNVASVALAARVKQAHPRVTIVFGGSNWDDEMGEELLSRFTCVDFACPGEADRSFPALVEALSDVTPKSLRAVRGVLYRDGGATATTGLAKPVMDLDALPAPVYDDYIAALRAHGLARRIGPVLLAEASRGCWWARREACAFCGSPGCRRPFRAKSVGIVLEQLRRLAGNAFCRSIEIVDDVPPAKFFNRALPQLVADPLPVPIFCEVRPEVSREHVRLLGLAEANVQPGIESLSDHVLALMRKGSRALENVRLLRWCREHGVGATWNLLYGVPGEDPDDYAAMLELLPAIRFLEPPRGCGPVRLDRFSAYWRDPPAYGLRNVRPLTAYRYIYPFPEASLRRIAYSFEYDRPPGHDPETYVGPVRDAVRRWQEEPDVGEITLGEEDGCVGIRDTRAGALRDWRPLSRLEAAVYRACDDICERDSLAALLAEELPAESELEARIGEALSSFVAEHLMIRDGDRYLSLALPEADEGPSGA